MIDRYAPDWAETLADKQRSVDNVERLNSVMPREMPVYSYAGEAVQKPVKEPPATQPWLSKALEATTSDRRRDYGHPLPNFLRIALSWTTLLETHITPMQVAEMMVVMKMHRNQHAFKDDNWIDAIGYSNTVEMMDNRMKEMGYRGIDVFKEMGVGFMFKILREHNTNFPAGT